MKTYNVFSYIRIIAIYSLLSLCLAPRVSAQSPAASPEQVVEETANQVLAIIESNRTDLQHSPEHLYSLVNVYIIPHFDFDTMAQWVMGRPWRTATETQRAQFTEAFKTLLINTYSSSLLKYSDEKITILKSAPLPEGAEETVVKTKLTSGQRTDVLIDYSMHKIDNQWLVFDVSIEGLSLVTNYRAEIGEQIKTKGVDGMITFLNEKNRSFSIPKDN